MKIDLRRQILFAVEIGMDEGDILKLGDRKEVMNILYELTKEGIIYPTTIDYGKMETAWFIHQRES